MVGVKAKPGGGGGGGLFKQLAEASKLQDLVLMEDLNYQDICSETQQCTCSKFLECIGDDF